MDLNLSKSIINKYNTDSNGNPISVSKEETQQIHTLKNLIQTEGIIDEYKRIQILDRDMVEVFNMDDIKSANQYYVDYVNGVMHFHPDVKGQSIKFEYGNLGIELYGANRIFTKQDTDGNAVEVLQDIIDEGREAIELIKTLGDAVVIIRKLEASVAEGKKILVDLENKKVEVVETVTNTSNECIDNVNEAIQQAKDEVIDVAGNEVKYITSNQWTLNSISKMYEYTLTHQQNSKALTINCYNSDTNDFVFTGGRILDKNRILFEIESPINLTVVINSKYYKPQITASSEVIEEVTEARKGEVDLKTKITKMDNAIADNSASLETIVQHNTSNLKVKSSFFNKPNKNGCIVFIDDDARIEVQTILKPLFEKYNRPFNVGVITGRVGVDSGYCTWEQLREMEKTGIAYMMSHTHKHRKLSELTYLEQEYEFIKSKSMLIENGLNSQHIVYPYNSPNNDTRKLAVKYFETGVGLGINTSFSAPANMTEIPRVELGSWQTKSSSQLKALIDDVKSNGKMLVFMTHIWCNDNNAYTDGNAEEIEEMLKYCVDNNVDVVTYDEAISRFGNIFDLGFREIANDTYATLGSDFLLRTNSENLRNTLSRLKIVTDNIVPSTHPNQILVDEGVVYKRVLSSEAILYQFPESKPGTLITERLGTGQYVGYTRQIYKLHNSPKEYIRYCDDLGNWSSWSVNNPFDWKCQSIDYDSSCNIKCTSTIDATGKSLLFITSPADTGGNVINWITPSKASQIIILINKLDADVTLRQGVSGANLHFKTEGEYILKRYKSISFINVSGELVEI